MLIAEPCIHTLVVKPPISGLSDAYSVQKSVMEVYGLAAHVPVLYVVILSVFHGHKGTSRTYAGATPGSKTSMSRETVQSTNYGSSGLLLTERNAL